MTRIAVVGLGEAGALYARGLEAAGAQVRGFDRYARGAAGLPRAGSLAEAVADADVVLSLVWARTAAAAAESAIPLMRADAVYADMNTAAPAVKEQIAAIGRARDVAVADVAVLAPVPRAAERTPLLSAGDGAARFAALMRPLGAPVEVLTAPAGEAARRKLLRSVFMKGLAALVFETLEAARGTDAQEWLRAEVARELGPDGDARVDRIVSATRRHIARREHEVRDVLAHLEGEGRHADVTRAALSWHRRILDEEAAGGPTADPER